MYRWQCCNFFKNGTVKATATLSIDFQRRSARNDRPVRTDLRTAAHPPTTTDDYLEAAKALKIRLSVVTGSWR